MTNNEKKMSDTCIARGYIIFATIHDQYIDEDDSVSEFVCSYQMKGYM